MCCVHSLVHIPQASPLFGISPDWPGRGLELACLVSLLISFHCANVMWVHIRGLASERGRALQGSRRVFVGLHVGSVTLSYFMTQHAYRYGTGCRDHLCDTLIIARDGPQCTSFD